MELHLQHGSQRHRWRSFQSLVELAQCHDLPEAEEAVGGLARLDCGLDHRGYESGAPRLSPMGRYDRCPQSVASGNGRADDLVVQVSLAMMLVLHVRR